ncbi:SDR family NAD(P)-dependent oxidoreductase [Streptomyces sp. enrichment culture]|uniref:SDR family NAD(P)-dependent oxidoreductase n=1 Tax=Streptomyces sp. enrichment culture TaxID=1795815 RepID=UPI003F54EE6C
MHEGGTGTAGARRGAEGAAGRGGPVAVIGLACRLPGGPDPAAFWRLLGEGRDAVGEAPPGRAPATGRPAGHLEDVAGFDPAFFGISPREARSVDPQQRLVLELAWEALEDAGVPAARLRGERVGVFMGAMADDWAALTGPAAAPPTPHTLTGVNRGMIANRVSYTLGLRGPSLTVDAAQASSLVAVHLACTSLRLGESAVALAGGVNLNLTPGGTRTADAFGALSPDGRCHTFDHRANGYVRGEGGATVVLKRLADAQADGDRVLCVIRGGAVNNDGGGDALTMPSEDAQRELLRLAHADAGVDAAHIDYVELHGTGTRAGDPVEAGALGAVLGAARPAGQPVPVGSVKTNIGHLEGASGIAGLVKTALLLHHRRLVPSLHFERAHPSVPLDRLNLRVLTESEEWPRTGRPPLAAVSSFGMGGTNCHLVLEAAPPAGPEETGRGRAAADQEAPARPAAPTVLPLTARSADALSAQAARLHGHLTDHPDAALADVAHSLATTRTVFEHRAAVLADDPKAALAGLATLAGSGASRIAVRGLAGAGGVCFLLPGQGSQRAGASRELYAAHPVFARAFDEVAAALTPHLDHPVQEILHAEPGSERAALLDRTGHTQPALFAFQTALVRLFEHWGIRPALLLGHSVGELTAAHVAGALTLPDAAALVAARGRLMEQLPEGGAMLAVEAAEEEVLPLLDAYAGALCVAAVNGPRAVVLSGDVAAVRDARRHWTQAGRRTKTLRVSHAFHSARMDPMLDAFRARAEAADHRAARIPFVSNLTGRLVGGPGDEQPLDADYWVRHAREAVRFHDGLRTALDLGVTTFLEIASGAPLAPMVHACAADRGGRDHGVVTVPALRPGRPEHTAALTAAAQLFVRGAEVDWDTATGTAGARRVPLPTYAFQRSRHWPEQPGTAGHDPEPGPRPAAGPGPRPGAADAGRTPSPAGGPGPDLHDAGAVLALVRREAADVLAYGATEELRPDRTFRDLGFDSFMGVELCTRLAAATGLDLPATLVFDHPTPQALVDHLTAAARPAAAASQAAAAAGAEHEPIAVVGMAVRAPGGVRTPEELWRLLAADGDAIGGFPEDRGWDLDRLQGPEGAATREGGFLHEAAWFDPEPFGISPREALAMDPQQRLLLETSWEALERAGIAPATLRGRAAGVFVGAIPQEYGPRMHEPSGEAGGYLLTGTTTSVASGRIAYTFGLRGPALTVDTACSSSLVALHLACQSLRRGETALALAGGVTVMAHPGMFVEFSRQGGLAPDGRCKSFGAGADGTGWSEGAGMLVLARLSDALREGHEVLAVVRGSAVNQDGASNGLTAPSGTAQQSLIREALADARLAPSDIDAVEAHGTGTTLGDPIEARALLATYGQDRDPDRPLWLGSVKSNIGHTQAAAGVIGVIKMVESLRRGVLPRSLHAEEPSPHVDWQSGSVALLTEAHPWPAGDAPRRAGVSSFGISGTNAHAIIEEAPPAAARAAAPAAAADGPVVPWLLSAESEEALRAQADQLAAHLRDQAGPPPPADVALSLATTRSALRHRTAVVGAHPSQLIAALARFRAHEAHPGSGPAFLFTGQGAQRVGMGRELYAAYPVFADAFDAVCARVDGGLGRSLKTLVFDGEGEGEGVGLLDRTRFTQAALFAVEVALFRLLESWGVRPDALLGHSVGEIVAAHVAGVLDLDDACALVVARGRLMDALPAGGAMVAVEASEDEVRAALVEGVSLAAVNGPRAVVVSGAEAAVEQVAAALAERGARTKRLTVSHAFHSVLMDPMLEEFRQVAKTLTYGPARIPVVSNLTGEVAGPELSTAGYWVRHVREAVRFADGVRTLHDRGVTRFLELGPDGVLTAMAQNTLAEAEGALFAPVLRKGRPETSSLVTTVADLHTHGGEVDWAAFFAGTGARPVTLPTYPFQRTRYWLASPASAPAATGRTGGGERYRISWTPLADPAARPVRRRLVVAPAGLTDPVALAVPAALAHGEERVQVLEVDASAGRAELTEALRVPLAAEGTDAVVSLLAFPGTPREDGGHLTEGAERTLALVQALGDLGCEAPLFPLTRGAVAAGRADTPDHPEQAAVWGLGHVARLEYPAGWGGLVDLPDRLDDRAAHRLRALTVAPAREDQVALRASGVLGRRLVRAPEPATATAPAPAADRTCGTVLVTGATGALGTAVARDLAARGAGHLLLLSRRGGAAPGAAELAAELRELGTEVTYAACDAADREALAAVIAAIPPERPLTAVHHVAGIVDDGVLEALTPERFRAVARAKAEAAHHLHELTRELPLTAFVLFSSVMGVTGNPGQGGYAAANAYLDALAAHRRAAGLTATSLAWGPWAGEGMAAEGDVAERLLRRGLAPLDPQACLEVLDSAVRHGETALTFADVRWDRFARVVRGTRPHRLLDEVAGAAEPEEIAAGAAGRTDLVVLPQAERERTALRLVRELAADVLGHPAAESVRTGVPFREQGVDSLASVQLRDRLARATGLRPAVGVLFDHPTPKALARHLCALAAPADGTAAAPAPAGAAPAALDDDPVAIVAMACRYPGGVRSPEELWRLVDEGRDATSPFPTDRGWDLATLLHPDRTRPGASAVGFGGFLDGAGEFDPAFFGVSPREAAAMDPQQRLLLELCWETLERAGLDPEALRSSDTGVFVGASHQDYGPRLHDAPEDVAGYVLTGSAGSVLSGRLAYTFGFEGPALTIDTACSSSLVALHSAVRALRSGECGLALAGGVTVMATPGVFVEFSRQRGLAPDGRCKAFAAGADGTAWAEGAGLLLLEKLSDARRNGHQVLAVIRGSAVNQDGASNGLTAPNGPSQQRVIRQALRDARLGADEVDAVEGHGTGTALGDPIEAESLLATYGKRPADRPLLLGSLKSNIGHAQAAAGVGGVIKMVEAMRHGILPRTLHVDRPNPQVDWDAGAVRLLTGAMPWPDAPDRPRRAAVSSFGISGTNAHVIVEQAPVPTAPEPGPAAARPPAPAPPGPVAWPLSARTEAALRRRAADLATWLSGPGRALPTTRTGHALATTRAALGHRAVLLGRDHDDFATALAALAEGRPAPGLVRGRARGRDLAFLLPGQGSQRLGAGRGLHAAHPAFADAFDAVTAALDPHLDTPVRDVLWADESAPGAALLDRTDHTQAALFALEVALFRLIEAEGVRPGLLIGHSVGEVAAAHLAGVLSLPDACALVAARGRLMHSAPGDGAMLAVEATEEEVAPLVAAEPARLSVAALNGPRATVLSGHRQAVEEQAAHWAARGRRTRLLRVSHGFHSPQMDPVLDAFREVVRELDFAEPRIPVVSNVTGDLADPALLRSPEYWVTHIRATVRFHDGVRAALRHGVGTFLELGAGTVLSAMAQECVPEPGPASGAHRPVFVPALTGATDEQGSYAKARALLHAHGHPADPEALYGPGPHPRTDLPTYPFERTRHWLTGSVPAADAATTTGLRPTGHPFLGSAIRLADGGTLLSGLLRTADHPWLADHRIADRTVVPGTALLEAVLHAGALTGCRHLEELTLETPLVLPEEASEGVRLQLTAAAPDRDGHRTVTLHSRPAADGDATDGQEETGWTRHAVGRLTTTAPDDPAAPATWPPADAHPLDLTALYRRFTANGLDYGPAFHGLRAAWRHGDTLYAELRAPEAADAPRPGSGFTLHPALLDAALHPVGLGTLDGDTGTGLLPFSFTGVRLYAAEPGPLHVRIDPSGPATVAVHLADAAGRTVAALDALALRPLAADRVRAAGRAPDHGLHRLEWAPAPHRPHTAAGAAGTGTDIAVVGASLAPALDVPAHPDLASLLATADAAAPRTVLAHFPPTAPEDAHADGLHRTAAAGLTLVQEFLRHEALDGSRLIVLTRGALATAPGAPVTDLAGAALWGLLRSAQSEHPGRFVLVDAPLGTDLSVLPGLIHAAAAEPQLALRDGALLVPRLTRTAAPDGTAGPDAQPPRGGPGLQRVEQPHRPLDPDGTVLVTGASGTLGGLFARHLAAAHGARRLLLVSRRGATAPGSDLLRADLEQLGAHVEFAAGDVADREWLAALIDTVPAARPLTAVVHAAGVLDDGVLTALTPERLATVLRPKADAALHLHHLTRDHDLAAFVLFSAAAGTLGTAGQANYAAANVLVDALAQHRRAQGLPALSLAWGLWAQSSTMTAHLDEGAVTRLARLGVRPLGTEAGLALFDAALATGPHADPLHVPAALDPGALRGPAGAPAILRALAPVPPRRPAAPGATTAPGSTAPGSTAPGSTAPEADSYADRLARLHGEARAQELLTLVRTHVAEVLGHPDATAVDPEAAFKELGFDSLASVELRNRLGDATGRRLPTTLVFDFPTPALIARHLDENLPGAATPEAPAPPGAPLTEDGFDRLWAQLSASRHSETEWPRAREHLRALLAAPAQDRPGAPAAAVAPELPDDQLDTVTDEELFDLIDKEFGD